MLTSGKFLSIIRSTRPTTWYYRRLLRRNERSVQNGGTKSIPPLPQTRNKPMDKHSTYIRLKLRETLKVNLTDITLIDIISLP